MNRSCSGGHAAGFHSQILVICRRISACRRPEITGKPKRWKEVRCSKRARELLWIGCDTDKFADGDPEASCGFADRSGSRAGGGGVGGYFDAFAGKANE